MVYNKDKPDNNLVNRNIGTTKPRQPRNIGEAARLPRIFDRTKSILNRADKILSLKNLSYLNTDGPLNKRKANGKGLKDSLRSSGNKGRKLV